MIKKFYDNNISYFRKKRGISPEELEKKTGLGKARLLALETHHAAMTPEEKSLMIKALGCTEAELMDPRPFFQAQGLELLTPKHPQRKQKQDLYGLFFQSIELSYQQKRFYRKDHEITLELSCPA